MLQYLEIIDLTGVLKELYNVGESELDSYVESAQKCECGSNTDRHSHWCQMYDHKKDA